jgi:hypothetical protein
MPSPSTGEFVVITLNIKVTAVSAVVVVAVVFLGSFFAGMRYQEHKSARSTTDVKAQPTKDQEELEQQHMLQTHAQR